MPAAIESQVMSSNAVVVFEKIINKNLVFN